MFFLLSLLTGFLIQTSFAFTVCLDSDIFDVNSTINNDIVADAATITTGLTTDLTNCIGLGVDDIALDDDWYAWTADFTGIAEITIEFVTSGFPDVGVQNLDLFVYNGTDSSFLFASSQKISHFSNIEGVLIPVTNGQDYRILVRPIHALFSSGSYTLNIRQTVECNGVVDMDTAEPNDSLQNATVLANQFLDATLCSLTDVDYYQFNVTISDSRLRWVGVRVDSLYPGNVVDLELQLLNSMGEIIQTSSFDSWCSPNCGPKIAAGSGWVFIDREVVDGELYFVKVSPAVGSSIPVSSFNSTNGISYRIELHYSGVCGIGATQDRISEYVASVFPNAEAGGELAIPPFQTLTGRDRVIVRDGLHICIGERSDTVFINIDPEIHLGFWAKMEIFTNSSLMDVDLDIYTFFSADPVNNPPDNGEHIFVWSSINVATEEFIFATGGPTCPICTNGVLPSGWYMVNFQTYDVSEDDIRTGTGPSHELQPGDHYRGMTVLCQNDGFGFHLSVENAAILPAESVTYDFIAPPCGPIPGMPGTDTIYWRTQNLNGIDDILLQWTVSENTGSNVSIIMVKDNSEEGPIILNGSGEALFLVSDGDVLLISFGVSSLDFYLNNGTIALTTIVTPAASLNATTIVTPAASLNVGAIVGGVIGGIFCLFCVIVGLAISLFYYGPRKSRPHYELIAVYDQLEHNTHLQDVEIGDLIGQGTYGNVYQADWRGTQVAAKNVIDDNFTAIEGEVNILKSLKHPHVLPYLGIALIDRHFYIITDFCANGDLLTWLRTDVQEVNVFLLLDIARQCAVAMEYLHTVPVIHRDLAARNILLTGNPLHPTCKVSDFGLSKTESYNLEQKIPIRWTAPEALSNPSRADKDSDVWSFGVLSWEIFSLGEVPYSNLSKNKDVLKFVIGGGKLTKPRFIGPDLWDLFEVCFLHSEERPTMMGLRKAITISCRLPRNSPRPITPLDRSVVGYSSSNYSDVRSETTSTADPSDLLQQNQFLKVEISKLKHKLFKAEQRLTYQISSSDTSSRNDTDTSGTEGKIENFYAYTSSEVGKKKEKPPSLRKSKKVIVEEEEEEKEPVKDSSTKTNVSLPLKDHTPSKSLDNLNSDEKRKKKEKKEKKRRSQSFKNTGLDKVQQKEKDKILNKAKNYLRQSYSEKDLSGSKPLEDPVLDNVEF